MFPTLGTTVKHNYLSKVHMFQPRDSWGNKRTLEQDPTAGHRKGFTVTRLLALVILETNSSGQGLAELGLSDATLGAGTTLLSTRGFCWTAANRLLIGKMSSLGCIGSGAQSKPQSRR